jgi:hypothetical protein
MTEPTPHEMASDDILSVVLNEESAWLTLDELGLQVGHLATVEQRAALKAILDLRRESKAVSDTTVIDRTGGLIGLKWISERFALYDATRTGQVYRDNIALVIKHGYNLGMQRLLSTALQQLKEGKKTTETVIGQTIDLLTAAPNGTPMKGESSKDIGGDFRSFMDDSAKPMLSTGLDFLDEITGGFEKQMIWWIAGAYKGRKSTLMFLLGLSALVNGGSVEFLSREMPRRRVAASMISILATAYLLRKDWYAGNDAKGIPLNAISASSLMRARKAYKGWDKRKVEAIDFGISLFEKFDNRLRIYDTSTEGGALNDWDSVEKVFKRDQSKYGTPDILFADYLQLFGAPSDKTYEKVAYLATHFQALAIRENLTVVVAAQKNEDSIKNGSTANYSPGIKGGGDPAQTADYMLLTSYKQGSEDNENQLKVTMKLSRHGAGGSNVDENYSIHPSSGLILSCNWIARLGV